METVEKFDSRNLRDLLRIKEEGHPRIIQQRISDNGVVSSSSSNSVTGVTLGAVLSDRTRRLPGDPQRPNRTLMDIIRNDRIHRRRDRTSWLQLKEKLRLRGGSSCSAWASTDSISPIQNSSSSNLLPVANSSLSSQSSISLYSILQSNDRTDGILMSPLEQDEDGQQPSRISLMALLEETDRQLGWDGMRYLPESDDDSELEHNSCCVCMVRQKGAAFIPCGHTFCRLCCRELAEQRRNCPLCNNLILEVLDIF